MMKQVTLKIPDDEYIAFLSHIKSKFSDIQIKEKKAISDQLIGEDSTLETMLLSEEGLAEDWLSDEDSRWDEVL